MEARVQQFVTIRFGDLWVDVPIGPLVTAVSESWKTTTASRAESKKEKEVSSGPKDGFVPVMSKSAKRRMRAAARASRAAAYDQHESVHKAALSSSAPPGFEKAKYVKPASQEAPMRFHNTLEEWPVLAKRAAPLKIASPARHELASSSTSTKVAVLLTPSKLKVGASSNKVLHEAPGASSYKPPSNTSGLVRKASAVEKGKVVMMEEDESPRQRGQLRIDAPKFIPTYIDLSIKRSLMWQGVYLTPDDHRTGHVDPTAALSDPLSSSVAMPCPSFEGSFDPAHHRRRRQRARQAWVDLTAAIDSNQARNQRKQVAYPIWKRDGKANARIRGRRHDDFHTFATRVFSLPHFPVIRSSHCRNVVTTATSLAWSTFWTHCCLLIAIQINKIKTITTATSLAWSTFWGHRH
jgi:hypothetical protein